MLIAWIGCFPHLATAALAIMRAIVPWGSGGCPMRPLGAASLPPYALQPHADHRGVIAEQSSPCGSDGVGGCIRSHAAPHLRRRLLVGVSWRILVSVSTDYEGGGSQLVPCGHNAHRKYWGELVKFRLGPLGVSVSWLMGELCHCPETRQSMNDTNSTKVPPTHKRWPLSFCQGSQTV